MARCGPKPVSLRTRFTNKLIVRRLDECWAWDGAKSDHGYGQVRGPAPEYILHYAHRLAARYFLGVNPGKLDVLHHCDNPECCNPTHLFLGTARDNILDAYAKGRMVAPAVARARKEAV